MPCYPPKFLIAAARMVISPRIRAILRYLYWLVFSCFARLQQNSYPLHEIQQAKKIIVFLLPEHPVRSGGILSIFNLCLMTKKIVHDATVVLATLPSFTTYARLTWFDNDEKIYRFSQIFNDHLLATEVYIHIPEYLSDKFYSSLSDRNIKYLKTLPHLHINILNQNIKLMPERPQLEGLFYLTAQVTQTTAHASYTSQQLCDRWGMPLHHFSAILPNPLVGRTLPSFEEKAARLQIFLSPDAHPAKELLQDAIKRGLPGCKITTVKDMTYSAYFSLISEAMFVMTFGEGFDAYFTQPSFVGTVSFSVFNEDFFPSRSWKDLENVFDSYDEAVTSIAQVMNTLLHNKLKYTSLVKKNRAMLDTIYSQDRVEFGIQRFYQHNYDFVPQTKNLL